VQKTAAWLKWKRGEEKCIHSMLKVRIVAPLHQTSLSSWLVRHQVTFGRASKSSSEASVVTNAHFTTAEAEPACDWPGVLRQGIDQ
jgi:hypothetical protein